MNIIMKIFIIVLLNNLLIASILFLVFDNIKKRMIKRMNRKMQRMVNELKYRKMYEVVYDSFK